MTIGKIGQKQIIEWDIFKSIIDDLYELGGCELISISGGGETFRD